MHNPGKRKLPKARKLIFTRQKRDLSKKEFRDQKRVLLDKEGRKKEVVFLTKRLSLRKIPNKQVINRSKNRVNSVVNCESANFYLMQKIVLVTRSFPFNLFSGLQRFDRELFELAQESKVRRKRGERDY